MTAYRFGLDPVGRPDLHTGHRQPFQHDGGSQQRSPVRPAQADGLPAKSLCSGQEPEALSSFEVAIHHAPTMERDDEESLTREGSENRRAHDLG